LRFAHRTILITGGSSGIGAAFATEFARRGADIVLAARRRAGLEELAARLRASYEVRVDVVEVDLVAPGAVRQLEEHVAKLGRAVDVLVNNAGMGVYGDVASTDVSRLRYQAELNVIAPMEMVRAFMPKMVERGEGVVINVASFAAFQPMPHMAGYAASKAFLLSFSEALWSETRATGVRVLALCPGPTDTPFHGATGSADSSAGRLRSPEAVVATAMRALQSNRPTVVDGRLNSILSILHRVLPRRAMIAIMERAMRPTDAG
jgi:short-subunit dehydrogenase